MKSRFAVYALLIVAYLAWPSDAFLESLFGIRPKRSNNSPSKLGQSRAEGSLLSEKSSGGDTNTLTSSGDKDDLHVDRYGSPDETAPTLVSEIDVSLQHNTDGTAASTDGQLYNTRQDSNGAIPGLPQVDRTGNESVMGSKTTSFDAERSHLLKKEIGVLDEPLGSMRTGSNDNAEPSHDYYGMEHAAFKSRIKEAMASLSSLYEVLHKARSASEKYTGEINKVGSENNMIAGEVDGQAHDSTGHQPPVDNTTVHDATQLGSRSIYQMERNSVVTLQPPTQILHDVESTAATPDESTTNATAIRAQDPDLLVSGIKPRHDILAHSLSALAGILFVVAAVSLMVAGVAQTHRSSPSTEPLYPPRGPAYV